MGRPTVFVVMPFSDEFQPIYDDFLTPTLVEAGYDVHRADDILSQRNILHDIIESIASADLIVADLTGANPNVYYELGLAHSLGKPVVLMAQDLDEVPFDLQSYRLVHYSTHFARIADARDTLSKLARGAITGETLFGNPVTDYSPSSQAQLVNVVAVERVTDQTVTDEQDDRGALDHLADLIEGFGELTSVVGAVAEGTDRIGAKVTTKSAELARAAEDESSGALAHMRKVARSLARDLEMFTKDLSESNAAYAKVADNTNDSMEHVVRFMGEILKPGDTAERDAVISFLDQIRSIHNTTVNAKIAYVSLSETMESVPNLERHLNRAITKASTEVRRMSENVGRTEASLTRATEVGDRLLAQYENGDEHGGSTNGGEEPSA